MSKIKKEKNRESTNSKSNIYKVGNALSILSFVLQVVCIAIFLEQKAVPKYLLICICIPPVLLWIYALVFKDDVSFERLKDYELSDLIHMRKGPLFITLLTLLFCFITLGIIGQIYKGFIKVVFVWIIVEIVFVLVGYIRFELKYESASYIIGYVIYVSLLCVSLVMASFYVASSKPEHVPCEYVSKFCSSTKNHKTYYVNVILQDGSYYQSRVDKTTYMNAETAELVSCMRESMLGVELIRIHCADQIVDSDK